MQLLIKIVINPKKLNAKQEYQPIPKYVNNGSKIKFISKNANKNPKNKIKHKLLITKYLFMNLCKYSKLVKIPTAIENPITYFALIS